MHVFAVDDPLPVHLRVSVSAALHSLLTAAKIASPPPEESYDSAWAPIAKKARPRLDTVLDQLRADKPRSNYNARALHLLHAFERADRLLAHLEEATPASRVEAGARLRSEVEAIFAWLATT